MLFMKAEASGSERGVLAARSRVVTEHSSTLYDGNLLLLTISDPLHLGLKLLGHLTSPVPA